VVIKTPAAVANGYRFGIFDSTGTQVWTSGAVSTTANYTTVTANTPFTLTPGTYYFAVTNNGSGSVTGGLSVTVALGSASLPRFGTVSITAGAMPSSINPSAITETTGGWPVWVVLSATTT
jgi:hypothetical protein